MPLYRYRAIDAAGKRAKGRLEAADANELERRLARLGLELLRAAPLGATVRFAQSRVRRRDLINFCFHLEQLTAAGIPLIDGLRDLRDSVDDARLHHVATLLVDSIEGGKNLSQALAEHPEVFDGVFVSLVRAGEHAGRLPEILANLVVRLRWEDELAAQTRKLLMYPVFVGGLVTMVTVFLMAFVVPQLAGFVRNLGHELPLQTRALLAMSEFIVRYGWSLVVVAGSLAFVIRALIRRDPRLSEALDRWKISLPLIGPIVRKVLLARFASSLALMYASGILVLDALRYAEATLGNRALQDTLRAAARRVAEGSTLAGAFAEFELLPPLVVRMLRIGEQTGAIDVALQNVSYFYNREVREAIAAFQSLIEPVLTVALGAVLGWVMLAVLGPVYDTIAGLKL
ncbi:MAG: secretion system protein [Betaproteobacteria bacterium RIFCSPLOWO2_02_FULL_66_14]|nr:MAG: secretion system protein [Betaproteobacteria bacterium RIFCSPLOWO2_02_FULL_66_14]